jgi:hypothetical protein
MKKEERGPSSTDPRSPIKKDLPSVSNCPARQLKAKSKNIIVPCVVRVPTVSVTENGAAAADNEVGLRPMSCAAAACGWWSSTRSCA